jgi:hypothetical protein
MGKVSFLLGAGVGFILGSRAGRGPYRHLESTVRDVTHRPDVQDKLGQVKDTAKNQAGAVAQKVVPSRFQPGGNGDVTPPDPSPESYADPQDLQFSTAAARKEDMVDELLRQGVPPADLEHKEDELRRSGAIAEPPAGNKPKPVNKE